MDTSTPGSGSESSHECSPVPQKYIQPRLHYTQSINCLLFQERKCYFQSKSYCHMWFCVASPVHWRVWTRPGCRPGSPCLCSAAPDPSECSRSGGIGRRCRPLTPAARAGAETRRLPSPPPGGRCTAVPGGGWSCSTQAAARAIRALEYAVEREEERFEGAHLVVVASRRQVLVVRRPLQTAHFLPVTL